MANILKCGKKDWYEAFGLELKRDDSKVAIFEDAGDAEFKAHLTLYRTTWQYTFQLKEVERLPFLVS